MSFSNSAVEAAYKEHSKQALARADGQTFIFYVITYCLGYLSLSLREGVLLPAFIQSAICCTVWLLPWLLRQRRPHLYAKHRRLWLTVHRLLNLLVPAVDFTLSRLPPNHTLKPSAASFVSALVFGSHISTEWALALGLRLDLTTHLALHSLNAARCLFTRAKLFCKLPYIDNLPTLQRFQAVSLHMAHLAGLLLVAPEGFAVGSEGAPGAVCHCYTLIAMLHIVFGFLLPAIAVYIAEQRSRSEYVMFRAAELGVSVAEVGEQIGLRPDEGLLVCCFDVWTAVARCVALLPPLSVSTWLAVLTLSTNCEEK